VFFRRVLYSRPMLTGTELRARRTKLGLTQSELAQKLEVSANTVARWERDEVGVPGMTDLALKALESQSGRRAKKPTSKKKRYGRRSQSVTTKEKQGGRWRRG
jgi:transcriptional regulator with XRE-family HTH domain